MDLKYGRGEIEMLSLFVDFNSRDTDPSLPVEPYFVRIRLDIDSNKDIREDQMIVGLRVILRGDDVECEAILRRGGRFKWVGELIDGTCRDPAPENSETLRR